MTTSSATALDGVRDLLAAEIDRGLETGVQLSVSHRGRVVDLALGDTGAGQPMTPRTPVPWTCSSKPLGAIGFALAWEAGVLDLDTTVSSVLPEFTGDGKDAIRVRDLLSHTTGMPDPVMALEGDGAPELPWVALDPLIWAVICSGRTELPPGTAMLYNPVSNWFVLDRLLAAVSGGGPGDSFRTLAERLGLTARLGVEEIPAEQRVRVGTLEENPSGQRQMELASSLPLPGIGVWGPVHELRTVGELLLDGGVHAGQRLLGRPTVEALTSTHWPGATRGAINDTDFPYGLGVMTLPAIFGRRCSARTFGHAGGNTSTLLVDPLFDLVVAVYWNGRLDDVQTFARRYALVRALYTDLGLPRLPVVPGRTAPEISTAAAEALAGER